MRVSRLIVLSTLLSLPAMAQNSAAFAPSWLPGNAPVPVETKGPRLLNESLMVAGAGLLLPMATYVAVTQSGKSFSAFFTGFSAASLLGWVAAPIAVSWLHSQLGGKGSWARALIGSLVGIAVGALVGLPLATLPNDGYHAGLGLLWALPATCTLVALEWG